MHLKGLDLNLLVTLDTLLEERSVSRAAERLHLSQPAVSAALARLRDFFKDDLLVLHGRKMIPTSYADSLIPELKSILAQVESLIDTPARFDPARSERVFRLMASDYITTVLIAPLVQRLQELAPRVQLDIRMPNEQMMLEFERGEIDLVLAPEPFISPDHPAELLFEESHVVVGWKGNKLLDSAISTEDFLSSSHVAVALGTLRQTSFAERFLDSRLQQRRIEVYVPSYTLVPWMLIGTSRLAVMHLRLAKVFARTLPLAIQPLPAAMPVMREMVQYHTARETNQDLIWLRQLLREQVNTEMALMPD